MFLGYFGWTTTAPAILGEIITAPLNVNAMTWRTCPAATELETLVVDWGLARVLVQSDPEQTTPYSLVRLNDAETETRLGKALGTPVYELLGGLAGLVVAQPRQPLQLLLGLLAQLLHRRR